MKREVICTTCPMGCRIAVEKSGDELKISGNGCPRGRVYAAAEVTDPVRMLTTSMRAEGREGLVSVKTSAPGSESTALRPFGEDPGQYRAKAAVRVCDV